MVARSDLPKPRKTGRRRRWYLPLAFIAWTAFLVSLYLPMTDTTRTDYRYGYQVLWYATKNAFTSFDLSAWDNAALAGTLSNLLMLSSLGLTWWQRDHWLQEAYNLLLLLSGMWAWTLLLWLPTPAGDHYATGFYLWAVAQSILGIRVLIRRSPKDGTVEEPDDWPITQSGDWDEGRK